MFDSIDRKVKLLIGQELVRVRGLPSHVRHSEPDERCPTCGHSLGDHHTDARGCSYCECEVQDAP